MIVSLLLSRMLIRIEPQTIKIECIFSRITILDGFRFELLAGSLLWISSCQTRRGSFLNSLMEACGDVNCLRLRSKALREKGRRLISPLRHHYNSLSSKMDQSLLTVRDMK